VREFWLLRAIPVGRAKLYLIRTLADSYVFESSGRESVHALNQGTAF